jgi:hypothetical protein
MNVQPEIDSLNKRNYLMEQLIEHYFKSLDDLGYYWDHETIIDQNFAALNDSLMNDNLHGILTKIPQKELNALQSIYLMSLQRVFEMNSSLYIKVEAEKEKIRRIIRNSEDSFKTRTYNLSPLQESYFIDSKG